MFKKIRIWFYNIRLLRYHDSLRRRLVKDYNKHSLQNSDPELVDALAYYQTNPITVFPYHFVHKYNNLPLSVHRDGLLPYIEYQKGKRLFFKGHWNENKVIEYAKSILAEQDTDSPHRYLTDDFDVEPDDTVIDIGVAEGNFSLSVVDLVKKVLIFEYDPGWLQALHKTFASLQDKVIIYEKRVSDFTDTTAIALDDLPELRNEKLFIKIDVDGDERKVLQGMKNILQSNKRIKVAICTYHNQKDAAEFEAYFQSLGFATSFSRGYMLFHFNRKQMKSPYLRKGVLRAVKLHSPNN